MRKHRIIIVNRRIVRLSVFAAFTVLLFLIPYLIHLTGVQPNPFVDPRSGIIVIDPGHGGIDGGTNKDGVLEKEANLAISKKLKGFLESKGFKVIMTREEDISLDKLNSSSRSRHQRDLNSRINIINNSNAQLFLSIHVNCNFRKPNTDGAIVFYNSKFQQNEKLAYCIQRSLNNMIINEKKRTVHDPQFGEYSLLKYSKVPGAIVETAFISNVEDRQLLTKDEFREQLALAIADGVECYLYETNIVLHRSIKDLWLYLIK
jgi:N-acetylmuramoyl-L-alanine amidase